LIPVYIIAALFAVLGLENIAGAASKSARVLAAVAVACSILYGLIMIIPGRWNDVHAALSSSFEAQRRLQEIPFLESFDYLNRDPSVSKVLIADPFVPGYYSDKTYIS
jgi:hypothetical protein